MFDPLAIARALTASDIDREQARTGTPAAVALVVHLPSNVTR